MNLFIEVKDQISKNKIALNVFFISSVDECSEGCIVGLINGNRYDINEKYDCFLSRLEEKINSVIDLRENDVFD